MADKLIKLDDHRRENLRNEIIHFFNTERDEDLGMLGADLVLDFFIEKLGPEIYNQGIADTAAFFREQADELAYRIEGLSK